jgi:hypothetical protein
LSTIYALVVVAARTLRNTSGLDNDTVEAMLRSAIAFALDESQQPMQSPAMRELEEWEKTQLRHWYEKGIPQC